MKKNKSKKNARVTINQTELIPTTIGELNTNDNGLFVVLAILAIFILSIVFLPNITNWFNNINNPEPNVPVTPPKQEGNKPNEKEPVKEIEYLDATKPIERASNGYRLQLDIEEDTKLLKATITNLSGSNSFLKTNKIYFELYSNNKQLLKRIKLSEQEVVSSVTYQYDIASVLQNNQVTYIVVHNMSVSDYPAVTLNSIDSNNLPFLTCTKDNETLIYTFNKKNNSYYLAKIKDTLKVEENDQNTINTYEAMVNSYNSIDGVEADISPSVQGFNFTSTIDLAKVTIKDKTKILNNVAYYEKNTEAKTVAFELNSSDYVCK